MWFSDSELCGQWCNSETLCAVFAWAEPLLDVITMLDTGCQGSCNPYHQTMACTKHQT